MVRVVLCNCSPGEAASLAKRLVEQRLAACVNIVDEVTSYYVWNGEMCEDREATLLIKTTDQRYRKLAEKLAEYHSYDVPEIVALDAAEVSEDYAEWVHEQVD